MPQAILNDWFLEIIKQIDTQQSITAELIDEPKTYMFLIDDSASAGYFIHLNTFLLEFVYDACV